MSSTGDVNGKNGEEDMLNTMKRLKTAVSVKMMVVW